MATKYTLEDLNSNETYVKTCPICDGRGGWTEFRAIDEYESADVEVMCSMCDGTGEVEVELSTCMHCGEVHDKDELFWVNDRYGIPFKKVCDDCYETVSKEIGSWEFDEDYCGESLDEDY